MVAQENFCTFYSQEQHSKMGKQDNITIQILGSGDAFGSDGHFQTSFYVSGKGQHFLVDCGATALISMKRHYISPALIQTIFLTHLHGDHFSGISFFLLDAQYMQQREEPLNIIGPKGTEEKVFQALELFYPGIDPKEFSYYIKFREYEKYEEFGIGSLTVQAFPVIHAPGSMPHGLRIAFGGKVLAFSGDTSWTDILYKISEQADVFICECNFYETPNANHINYKELMNKKEAFTCKKMILNHLSEEMLRMKERIEIPIAEEGQTIEV